jgi:CBS domain-containing protein
MAFVEQLSDQARERLVAVAEETPLIEVARRLHAGTDLVVVCTPSGTLAGILTKTDLVAYFVAAVRLDEPAREALVARSQVVTCRLDDELHAVWRLMHARDLKNIPIVDKADRPIGILNARDALGVLLVDSEIEESLLRDYVMGLGYR